MAKPDQMLAIVTLEEQIAGNLRRFVARAEAANQESDDFGQVLELLGREGAQDVEYEATQPFLTAGAPRWDEHYTMWATIQVLKQQTVETLETAEKRAWTLAYELVGAISADLTLGVSLASEVLMFQVDTVTFDDKGRFLDKGGAGHQLAAGLGCFARLRIT